LRQTVMGPTGLFRLTEDDALSPAKPAAVSAKALRLNWTQALDTVSNDRALLAEVMDAFLEEGPMLRDRMRGAAVNEDWTVVAKSSHTLQAALRLFGGEPLELAKSLEDRCKRGTPDESRGLFAKFSAELENVFVEVRDFLKGT